MCIRDSHDADNIGIAADCGLENLAAVDPRQAQIRNHDVKSELGKTGDRLFAVGRLDDIVALIREPLGYHFPERRLVLDNQQMSSRCLLYTSDAADDLL